MRWSPIKYNAFSVNATLAGIKKQTRRLVEIPGIPDPRVDWESLHFMDGKVFYNFKGGKIEQELYSPYGYPGDRLWVQEEYAHWEGGTVYRADNKYIIFGEEYLDNEDVIYSINELKLWKKAFSMRPIDCRLSLEITNVRAERIQDISKEDAIAEGASLTKCFKEGDELVGVMNPIIEFRNVWESIYGLGAWDANNFVWVYDFKVLSKRDLRIFQ